MMYTFEVYTQDLRKKDGVRLVKKYDQDFASDIGAERHKQSIMDINPKLTVEVYETYVTRKNMMSGKEYQERYDTPDMCSPSSETYWSM